MPANNEAHERLLADALVALSDRGHLAWKQKVGIGVFNHHLVRFGMKGQSDIFVVRQPDGLFVTVEVKTGRGKLTDHQKFWFSAVARVGGRHVEGRSVDQSVREVEA